MLPEVTERASMKGDIGVGLLEPLTPYLPDLELLASFEAAEAPDRRTRYRLGARVSPFGPKGEPHERDPVAPRAFL